MAAVYSFPDFFAVTYKAMATERPPLLDAAAVIGDWWDNGKTGDILNISMPARFGKSTLATAFSIFLFLRSFDTRILRVSYAAELAETFSEQVKNKLGHLFEYIENAPRLEGTRARWKIGRRDNDSHTGVGIGGGVTGFGYDLAIVDDTAKNMIDAMSASYSKVLSSFKESVLVSRMEGRKKILNVGTRWTVNDWFSMWPDAQEYVLPAMVDGRSVCEAWKTTEELELERERVSEEVWQAQYMQRPTATGRIRLFEGWQPEAVSAVPDGKHFLVIDPAQDYGKDYFVIGDYVRVSGLVYLCGMFARQRATIEETAAWCRGREYSVCWCEANGVGADVANNLRRQGVKSVACFSTTSDKYSRAWVRLDDIKNYLRIGPGCDPESVRELLVQADEFPAGTHDDLIDNIVMAFERIR